MSIIKLRNYIREEPQRPKGLQNRTPVLVSDSKGLTLRNYCPDFKFPFEQWCISGARTRDLLNIIKQRTTKALQRHGKILIYLWAGTCDITKKCGKEICIRNKDNITVNNIIRDYQSIIEYLEQFGADVILKIVDLPILSIQKWNTKHLRNNQIKPQDLQKYKDEDKILTEQISDLNKRIWQMNKTAGHQPIKTSQFYFRTRGGKVKRKQKSKKIRHSVRISLNKEDGVHPGKTVSLVITKLLLLDSYTECFISVPSEDILQIRIDEEELLKLSIR